MLKGHTQHLQNNLLSLICLALVTEAELTKSSENLENTVEIINFSTEFLEIFKLSYTFIEEFREFDKKQIKILITKTDQLLRKVIKSGNTNLDDIIILAYTYQNIGYLYMWLDEKDSLYIATNNFLHCLDLIRNKELDRKSILLAMRVYNYLGSIYYVQNKKEKSVQIYDKAVKLYLAYIQDAHKYGCPVDFQDIIIEPLIKVYGYKKMADIYIVILRELIDLHVSIEPNLNDTVVVYTHMLLDVQFSEMTEIKHYVKWIQTAITLVDFFLTYGRFKEANNHLIAANFVRLYFMDVKSHNIKRSSFEIYELQQQNQIMFMLIAIYQAKYGVMLLRYSAERLLRLEKDENCEINSLKPKSPSKSKKQVPQKLLLFTKVEKDYSNAMYHVYPVTYISDYAGAKQVFVITLKWLYYTGLPFSPSKSLNEYIAMILSICNAHKYMALYEKDTTSQILLHNRRLEVLMNAIMLIDSKHCNVLKYLRLQLAIAYSTLINIRIEELETVDPLYTPQRYDTINLVINNLLANSLMNLKKI